MDRRTFLKIAGMGSLAFAAACSREGEKNLFSLVTAPDDLVTGKANWYASTCRECPAGCGLLAKNREGRVIKLEGNPLHPINRGSLCIRGQAALQGIYNPDRLSGPLVRGENGWRSVPYSKAIRILKEKLSNAAGRGDHHVRMISEVEGSFLWELLGQCMAQWQSSEPLAYEPFGFENLKKANDIVYQMNGLIRYRMDASDFILGFGADFLETWLSPVEYTRRFKRMHRFQDGTKGMFVEISPARTLTGANADEWIACPPEGQTAVCLALIRTVLAQNRASSLPPQLIQALKRVSASYTREAVARQAGIAGEQWDRLIHHLLQADRPLVLGTSTLNRSPLDLQTNIAVNLLNYALNPLLPMHDFKQRHRVESASTRSEVTTSFHQLGQDTTEVLLLNNVNPVYTLPPGNAIADRLQDHKVFVVYFSNFMDETAQHADLILPVSLPLESWGEYSGSLQVLSTLQPAMTALNGAPMIGDLLLELAGKRKGDTFKHVLFEKTKNRGQNQNFRDWLDIVRNGGNFDTDPIHSIAPPVRVTMAFESYFERKPPVFQNGPVVMGLPSIRFFDGRGANRPWLCEIPDPVTKIAWQTPLLVHPQTAIEYGCKHEDVVSIQNAEGRVEAAVYETRNVHPGLLGLPMGQGHTTFGRYASEIGVNPVRLFGGLDDPASGAPLYASASFKLTKTGRRQTFARTDGSADQHDRKIALTIGQKEAGETGASEGGGGLDMDGFPMTLPLPEGYDKKRDYYPPHDHENYRWAMVIDLDRCTGCNACAAACYAENNIGIVGEKQVINGREMSWMRIERYRQAKASDRLIFLPMLCQHCDNAPCEAVCPVYAPHHSKEGLNNQIYNRCIGTRFCAQNCPYKVRRFNWLQWPWPEPLQMQLNPEVTVRSKGVMEKCSFCVQRIKQAHGRAKDENRLILDGEVTPACAQTCPTRAITFGSLLDKKSRVARLVTDRRAYQVMGYLNTKPAIIYLRKVVHT